MKHLALSLIFIVLLSQSALGQVVHLKIFAADTSSIAVEVDLCRHGEKLIKKCETLFPRADKLHAKAIAEQIGLHGLKTPDLALEILTYKDENSTHGKVVLLPPSINNAILKFLVEDPATTYKQFNCRSFAHWVNELDFTHGKYSTGKWSFGKAVDPKDDKETLSFEKILSPGETILLEREAMQTFNLLPYWAIYLGEGLYITKFGFADDLGIRTLKDLARYYGSNEVRAVRKHDEDLFFPCTIL